MYERFSTVYDALMAGVDYDAWAAYIDKLIKRYSDGPSHALLECACGTGELTFRLDELGYNLVASDLSTDMLRIAEEKCRRRGVRIPFVAQDMTKLSFEKPFDALFAACDGVNYLLSERELRAFLSSAHAVLRKNGLLLFDMSSKYKLENILGCNTFGEDGKEIAYVWKNMYDPKSALLKMKLAFFVRKDACYERFDERQVQRAYNIEEITDALNDCGFKLLAAFDAFTESPTKENSERIQLIARKNDD